MGRPAVPASLAGRRGAALVLAVALLALPFATSLGRGGYFDVARLRAGVAACLLAALAMLVSRRPLPATRAGRGAVAALAGLSAWTALSVTWAPLRSFAIGDTERLVLYLAALVAAAALLRPPAARLAEPVLLGGIAAAFAYGLSERLLPGLVSLAELPSGGGRRA
jgi:hypothetical protein